MKAAFTLLEVLVVFAVLAVLAAVAIPASTRMSQYSARMKSISNLRQIGVAARLYANDNNQQLPGQPSGPSLGLPGLGLPGSSSTSDQWPKLFCAYLSPSDPRVFLDPSDSVTAKLPLASILSDTVNNTGFVYNGFNDLGADNQPVPNVALTRFDTPAEVVLLGQKTPGATAFYVNLLFNPLGDILSLLNANAYDGGSHYLFVDGSVRFIKQVDYSSNLWLVNKNVTLPMLGSSQVRWAAQLLPVAPSTAF